MPSATERLASAVDKTSYVVKGKIWTGDGSLPYAGWFRVRDGAVTETGLSGDFAPEPGEELLDFGTNLVLPGFTDAHIHFTAFAKRRLYRDLSNVRSLEEMLDALREECAKAGKGKWVRCINYNESCWENPRLPDIHMLDEAAPDNPVILSRYCGHNHNVNTAGFKKAGLYDSESGDIVRGADGTPTGLITEGGAGTIIEAVAAEYETPEKLRELIHEACIELVSQGITAVHANDAPSYALGEDLAAMQDLEAQGRLPLRVLCYHDRLPNYTIKSGFGNDMISFAGLKLFADGCLGGHTAALNEPYSDAPETRGLLNWTDGEMYSMLAEARRRGIQVQIHAIGDTAIEQVVGAIEKVVAEYGRPELPFRINHCIVCPKSVVERIAASGSAVDLQPVQAYTDRQMAPLRLGARMEHSYSFRTLQDAGILLTGSSDAPVEDPNPWISIWCAVCRSEDDGSPLAGFNPDEKLDLDSALKLYTVNPWKAVGRGGSFGKIAPGYAADFTVVDGDPTARPEDGLRRVKNIATFVGGRCVFKRD